MVLHINFMSQVLVQILTVTSLRYYRTQRFINYSTKAHHWALSPFPRHNHLMHYGIYHQRLDYEPNNSTIMVYSPWFDRSKALCP